MILLQEISIHKKVAYDTATQDAATCDYTKGRSLFLILKNWFNVKCARVNCVFCNELLLNAYGISERV